MTTTLTIADQSFTVSLPYAEAQPLRATEATILNNRWKSAVTAIVKKAIDTRPADDTAPLPDFIQSVLTDVAAKYRLGDVWQAGGGRLGNPVEAWAQNFALGKVKERIKQRGGRISDYSMREQTKFANDYVAEHRTTVMKLAEAAVAAQRELPDAV